MILNINRFLNYRDKDQKISDFQDLDHIDGLSIATTSANLYGNRKDDLVLFYFRNGANYASVYTQSKIISENIKWNKKIKLKKVKGLLVNTRNANAFTGEKGYKGLKILAKEISEQLTEKQNLDEQNPSKIKSGELMFACTGTIGEPFPTEKIKHCIPELIKKIKYTQNKYIWMKAAMGILTTDTKPKLAMEECKIGNSEIKIYGIAKGAGMIYPNMATTLGFVFTDANLSPSILKNLLKKNIHTTFNAISCDGDTSTNDMVSVFATCEAKNPKINSPSDKRLDDFNKSLHSVLLNLAKRVASDGEGASKFITINVINCKNENHARKISFSIANSPLFKTAIAGEDPNWGRIIMAIGKAYIKIDLKKLSIKFGLYKIIEKGELHHSYDESKISSYMKNNNLDITVDLGVGKKKFTAYTMDLTKKYIEINSDYRS